MRKLFLLLSIFIPSIFRIPLLNILGYRVSPKAKLGLFSVLLSKEIIIEEGAKLDSFSVIAGLRSLVLRRGSGVSRFTYISGGNKLELGQRSLIGSRCIINPSSGDVVFGEYSVLAPRSTIYTHGTFLPATHGYSFKNKGVNVGSYTWIMQNASIGPGVNIGSNVIVLPGSVIVKAIPDNIVVYDTPIERKTFPINLFKKKLTNLELEKLIKDITHHYLKKLKASNTIKTFVDNDSNLSIKTNSKNITIHFCEPQKEKHEKKKGNDFDCYFWYDIEKDIMLSSPNFILDFKKIMHSSAKPPKALKDYNAFMFYEYGLKFLI
jgi:acetyltransferase-like isoleucine patch superfamily enzyme